MLATGLRRFEDVKTGWRWGTASHPRRAFTSAWSDGRSLPERRSLPTRDRVRRPVTVVGRVCGGDAHLARNGSPPPERIDRFAVTRSVAGTRPRSSRHDSRERRPYSRSRGCGREQRRSPSAVTRDTTPACPFVRRPFPPSSLRRFPRRPRDRSPRPRVRGGRTAPFPCEVLSSFRS